MYPNHHSVGSFLRSSVFTFIILGNLIFSTVFMLSLSFHIAKPKEEAQQIVVEKQAQKIPQSIVTLARIR